MAGMPMQHFEGQRTGSVVYHAGDGLFYHLNNNRPSRTFAYLRCIRADRAVNPCPGTAKSLLNFGVLIHLRLHNHPPKVTYPQVQALRKKVTSRVKAGDSSPFQEILQQEGQGLPIAVRAQLPVCRIQSRLNKIRAALRPPVPQSLQELGDALNLPQYNHIVQCLDMPESLFAGMCGTAADETLSLVFICPRMMHFMQTRIMFFADGTKRKLFKKPKASQIFNVNVVWRYHVIPVLRAIMMRRTKEAYLALFNYLKVLMPHLNPAIVMCDYEEGQMTAWKLVFPLADVDGCLYHYAVAIYRYADDLGLKGLIEDEDEVSSIIRSAGALPLLPPEDIAQGLEELGWEARNSGWMPVLKQFFKYLAKEWIPKAEFLSVYKRVHRTNNASESANRSFNKLVKNNNPSWYEVLRAFVSLNDRALVDIATLRNCVNASRPRKASALSNDRKIQLATLDLEHGDITCLQFLHRASRRMQGVFNNVFH